MHFGGILKCLQGIALDFCFVVEVRHLQRKREIIFTKMFRKFYGKITGKLFKIRTRETCKSGTHAHFSIRFLYEAECYID